MKSTPKSSFIILLLDTIFVLLLKVNIYFQCEPAVANALKFISISLTTYSELYFGSPFWIVPFRFFKYVFNDTARGNRHVAISKICDAKFIKAYWSCSETGTSLSSYINRFHFNLAIKLGPVLLPCSYY